MAKVYIVMGDTGEWSDHREWPVVAYLDEQKATDRVTALDTWLVENKVSRNHSDVLPYEERDRLKNPLDPNFQADYTGTRYSAMEVELGD